MQPLSSARALGLAALLCATSAGAADHQDGAAVLTDPASDINDVFAWTSPDGTRLNLVMDVFPFATTAARFSDAVQYVFHTSSSAGFGMASGASADILCTFDAAGCPALDSTTANALVTQLRSAPGGGAPTDHFAGANTLAIVVQIDRTLVTAGGATVAVWASTNK